MPVAPEAGWDQCMYAAGFVPKIDISYFSDTFIIWLKHEKNTEYCPYWTRSAYNEKYPLILS